MKKYVVICAMALASCAGNNQKADSVKTDSTTMDTSTKPNIPAQDMEYCFIRTDGTAAQDTTAVHLNIKQGKVTGEMKWIPKEKDSRKGTLEGTISGDTIKAVWSFMQEGMKDTLGVEFKLSAQQLAQKPSLFNKDTGREQLINNAGYTIIYKLDNCDKFKTR